MTIDELVEKLKAENLMVIHDSWSKKKYISGEKVLKNNKWINTLNVFGICDGGNNDFCFFITDSERGIPEYSRIFASEDEVCKFLYKKITRMERIYQDGIK